MLRSVEELKDRYKGMTAWIVGKGPSLQYLKKEDIGAGPVITINSAITAVESLGFENPLFSMQKDGGGKRQYANPSDVLLPDCDYAGSCGDRCGEATRPRRAPLLLHDLESRYCFSDYEERYVFKLSDIGLEANVFSLIFAVKVAQYMGCERFLFLCCDVHVNGDWQGYDPAELLTYRDPAYLYQRQPLRTFMADLDHAFITPGVVEHPKRKGPLKISFGVVTNHPARLDMAVRQSEISGELHFITDPESATKGLNKLLKLMEEEAADIGILSHHDMSYRSVWIEQVRQQLELLPETWIVAGIIGKDMHGAICGRFQDMRIPLIFNTEDLHAFPVPASCFDECCIIVNLRKEFRFDETLDGFDLYGTLCVLQAWQMNGTAWIIDSGACAVMVETPVGKLKADIAYAQHHCTRPFTWMPDEEFGRRFIWLRERFPEAPVLDSTVFGVPVNLEKGGITE